MRMLKLAAAFAILLATAVAALAQKDDCSAFSELPAVRPQIQQQQQQQIQIQQQQIQQQQQQQQPIDPSALLNGFGAIDCVVDGLRKLRSRIDSPEIALAEIPQLVRLTGAARTILVNGGLDAIERFRRADDSDTIAVLAFAARGSDQAARINATRVLADVIDNNSACVVIDHLYDPKVHETDFGRSGRVNLLGVISVVAPWAYVENIRNIERLVDEMRRRLRDEKDVAQTLRVLENIQARLSYKDRPEGAFLNSPLPEFLQACKSYIPLWAKAGQLVY